MKKLEELRELTVNELNDEIIKLRKEQFSLRLQKANGSLTKTHQFALIKKAIAQTKTVITEKAGVSHVK